MTKRLFTDRPVDLRHVPSPIYLAVEGERVPHQAVWMRTRGRCPTTPAVHRAALAYLSDLTIQESILRAHGVAWATPGAEGREPRPRDVVAPARSRRRVDAVRAGVAERPRRPRTLDRPDLLA